MIMSMASLDNCSCSHDRTCLRCFVLYRLERNVAKSSPFRCLHGLISSPARKHIFVNMCGASTSAPVHLGSNPSTFPRMRSKSSLCDLRMAGTRTCAGRVTRSMIILMASCTRPLLIVLSREYEGLLEAALVTTPVFCCCCVAVRRCGLIS